MPSSADAAGRFPLGGRPVARLGLGTMRLTGTLPFHAGVPYERSRPLAVLRRALELGVDHLDTAAFYFSRTLSALELVNAATSGRDDVVVATKVGPRRDAAGEWADRPGPGGLRAQVEENLRGLGRARLDLVYLRVAGPGPVAEDLGVLADLVTEGLIAHLGVSGVTAEQFEEARGVVPVAAVQNRLSPDRPGDLALLRRCGELGVAFVPFFTVSGVSGHGAPGALDDQPDAVRAVAAETGATPAQVRLAWTLALGPHVLVIPGTATPAHLEDNVAAAGLELSADQLARLDRAAG